MLKIKVLTAFCLGTAVYVFLSLFGGQDGVWATRQLAEQKQYINAWTNDIVNTNRELSLIYAALKQDSDIIASYARNLGYVSDAEKLVKIIGLSPRAQVFDPGTVIKRDEIVFFPEWVCKLAGVVVGALAFAIFVLMTDSKTGFPKPHKNDYQQV
jgi:cell division protein FtsB